MLRVGGESWVMYIESGEHSVKKKTTTHLHTPIKDTLKEDKPLNKGQSKSMHSIQNNLLKEDNLPSVSIIWRFHCTNLQESQNHVRTREQWLWWRLNEAASVHNSGK